MAHGVECNRTPVIIKSAVLLHKMVPVLELLTEEEMGGQGQPPWLTGATP